jgi:biotin-(acetyl-CoA carboxylase) ligase
VVSAWRSRSAPWWGGRIEVRTGEGVLEGRLVDVDGDGALVVEVEGQRRRLLSGEVAGFRRVAGG